MVFRFNSLFKGKSFSN